MNKELLEELKTRIAEDLKLEPTRLEKLIQKRQEDAKMSSCTSD